MENATFHTDCLAGGGNAADKLNCRNIIFLLLIIQTFLLNIEAMIFIFYSDEITIDVKRGHATRHKN
jgi:hypothetical protein